MPGDRGGALVIAFLLLAAIQVPSLACNAEAEHQTLLIVDGEKTIGLEEFRFGTSPFVREHLACSRWLEELQTVPFLTWAPLLNPRSSHLPSARLTGDARAVLYRECARSPHCELRAPYGWGPWGLFGSFDEAEQEFGNDAKACTAATQPRPRRQVDVAAMRARPLDDFSDVDFWFAPKDTLAAQAASLIERSGGAGLFGVATMTVSSAELARLVSVLERNPSAELFVLFDLNAALHAGLEVRSRHPRLFLVPIFNTPTRATYFHYKGAVSLSSGERIVFTSVNLQSYVTLPIFDLGVSARSPRLAAELRRHFVGAVHESCAARALLRCTIASRYADEDERAIVVADELSRSCARSAALAVPPEAIDPAVFSTTEVDVESVVLPLIASAERSVHVSSHRFKHPRISDALARAPVERSLFLGLEDQTRNLPPSLLSDVVLPPRAPGLQPHAKAVLVDGRRLLWGTGNLTQAGLSDASELFFYTEQPEIVNGLRKYLNTLAAIATRHPARAPFRFVDETAIFTAAERTLARRFEVVDASLAECLREASGPQWIYTPEVVAQCTR